ncbi:putative membrane protein YgcG [Streptosporangium album]|uniref:Putative membrane protein YgcG n=1 Tax=Streptosporangium album TaxID=47479 RepID=A0A7W7W7V6_9ACTN|nr:TPM domain-containing protein [Streptosporangium album]MBB4936434.1 putative membrane protein YgcG [Streptosporangium album]
MRVLSPSQAENVREALRAAEHRSGLRFAAYLGPAVGPHRHFSERLHAALGEEAARAVLVFVDPAGRALEIVTGPQARWRLPDVECHLTAMRMAHALGGGDLAGGLVTGVGLLADLASRSR